MSTLPVDLAFRFSPFLRAGEVFRIYAVSSAIAENLTASIVVARRQRKERMEYCGAVIREYEEKLLQCTLEQLRREAWGEPWWALESSNPRQLHEGHQGRRGIWFDYLFLSQKPVVFYSSNEAHFRV